MRAMDNTAKAPTQVIITALDSRSFAEYLNENSDILQAVLSKNNAMGRRAWRQVQNGKTGSQKVGRSAL